MRAFVRVSLALFSWRYLLRWYLLTWLVGTLGTWAAYGGPFATDTWTRWSGQQAWIVDSARLGWCSLIALYIVWSLGVLNAQNVSVRSKLLDGWASYLPVALALFAVIAQCIVLPLMFHEKVLHPNLLDQAHQARMAGACQTARCILLPYVPYSLYSLGLWIFALHPPVLCIVVSARADFAAWQQYRDEFERTFEALPRSVATDDALMRAKVALQNHVARLQRVGERSLPVVLAAALLLSLERLTRAHETTQGETQSLTKIAVWLLIGPAVMSLLVIVASGYQQAIRQAERVYRQLLDCGWGSSELRAEIYGLREDLIRNCDGASFIFSIVRSTSVFVLLVNSGILYVVESLDSDHWLSIFVPDPVVEFFGRLSS